MNRWLSGLVVALGVTIGSRAQTPVSDLQLLADRDFQNSAVFAQYRRAGNSQRPVQYRQRSWVARYNPVSLVLKGSLLGYQRLMSQQLARNCPYQITCSNFSKLAIERYGLVKGVFMSADRIMRCNRIGLLDVPAVDLNPADGTIIDSLSRYQ
ncbi:MULTISPECIES: membrane protein insertion efficiency factor YidD [Spirosoma]|uniref:Membrane protein insertion efficiency factor YidD n=1 Tax=Spirosoma sordidisoli TaxID=2502893 RepID=A0A4Q2UH44_9BACT|nr:MULTISPECIES: membrane protein insertion efficiency factor YidD [Spirosoma]RYC68356.1 membrane protein insertion efficiency factor YidD [Spirosoma sordidisoli]